jgi:hypothetical protein
VVICRGDVLRYHPIIGLPAYIRVRIDEVPWMLGDGSWICKARGVDDARVYRPSVEALEPDVSPATKGGDGP